MGLVLIHDCCHMEAGLGTPTNHPSIYPLLGILDLYLHSNIRNRLEGDKTDCTPSTNLRTFLQLIIDNFIAYMMTYSYIKSNCNYILGDEDLHYSDTNETAHLIKSPIHPNLFRVTH